MYSVSHSWKASDKNWLWLCIPPCFFHSLTWQKVCPVQFVSQRLLRVSQSHLPHGHGAVNGAGSSSKDQQQIRQVLHYVAIPPVQQVFLCAAPLFSESFVLKSQTASHPLCIFPRHALLATIEFWGVCWCFAAVALVQAERLQLDGSLWA